MLVLSACAGRGDDPYAPFNRQMHAFNAGVDAKVVRPLTSPLKRGKAQGAPSADAAAAPSLMDGITNIGGNLSLPGKVVNHLLQGRPQPAAQNAGRFLVNSTLGLGGLMDPAGREFALTEVDTDFGETLHVWGVPEGAYLELPILGPSSERDAAGRVVDWLIDPMDQWLPDDARVAARAVKIVAKVGKRAKYGDTVDSVLHDSADSYTQTKLLYQQHRRHELGQEAEIIDPYSD
ncbi:VacJ family lipoprotein [Paracoccus suum]|uniref:VacJ family lipoprotein n=1 Tax=Paracoccus suum TaxID=2259340 RepID=A0A344PHE8_9RHOB|nr:VacJ family lipoprotein [Paracoccus suum]AXC48803.1 VacJ family lipoprotein [Paracoccus suum]